MRTIEVSALLALAMLAVGCQGISRSTGVPAAATGAPVSALGAAGVSSAAARETPGAAEGVTLPAPTTDPTLEALYADFRPPIRGSDHAPVLLYVFSDYLCPPCRSLAMDTEPLLVSDYVEPGRLAIVFLDFPLPAHGYPAMVSHEAAHCAAEQGRYWEMHDALFAAQDQLAALNPDDEDGSRELVAQVAARIGLDADELRACVATERYRPMVASLYETALQKGVTTAPTLLIQSETATDVIDGNPPIDELRSRMEAALAEAEAAAQAAGSKQTTP